MTTPTSQFIKDNGGALAMAQAIGCPPGRVRMWSLRGRIPRTAWPEIIDAFPKVTLDKLRAIEPPSEDRSAA